MSASVELRRSAGVVYTPPPMAAFVVDRLLAERATEPGTRWLDPACGDGVFLVELVRRLCERVGPVGLSEAVELGVFGIDVDARACVRAREAVERAVASAGGRAPDGWFAANVQTADFLDLEPDAGFDFVVGNPPYVSAGDLAPEDKRRFLERFESAWGRLDLYALFIEHGLRFLAPGGRLGYITPDKWLMGESSSRLRRLVAADFSVRSIDRFDRHDLFPGVATVPCVTVIERPARGRRPAASAACRFWDLGPGGVPGAVSASRRVRTDSPRWIAGEPAAGVALGSLVQRISAGLATGLNRCFVLDGRAAELIEPELLRPAVRGRDVGAGAIADPRLWLLLPYEFDAQGGRPRLIDLADYPRARAYLERHQAALERRHCVRVWGKAWYDLHDPVTHDLAHVPKLVAPDIAREPRFAFDPGTVVPLHSAYYLVPDPAAPISPTELARILNSPAVAAELRRRAPTAKSGYRRFRAQVLRELALTLPSVADAA